VQTPSSKARDNSGWCDSRTRSGRWWSKVGYRKKRSYSRLKCLSGSRMPPLRRVTSCSPSARARTVTAHSLKAIGIYMGWGNEEIYGAIKILRARTEVESQQQAHRLYASFSKSSNVAA